MITEKYKITGSTERKTLVQFYLFVFQIRLSDLLAILIYSCWPESLQLTKIIFMALCNGQCLLIFRNALSQKRAYPPLDRYMALPRLTVFHQKENLVLAEYFEGL